jgi:hypothetical protein
VQMLHFHGWDVHIPVSEGIGYLSRACDASGGTL